MTTFQPILTLALWNNYVVGGLLVGFIAICVLMVLAVLIQKPQGGGLAGAFGAGASSGQTAFGTKTGDALTLFTIGIFILFLVFAVLLNLGMKPQVASAENPNVQPTPTTAPASAPATTPDVPGAPATTPGAPAATNVETTNPPQAPAPTTPPAEAPPATVDPQPVPAPAPTQPK
jgi:preprotein translocase subunit SecG